MRPLEELTQTLTLQGIALDTPVRVSLPRQDHDVAQSDGQPSLARLPSLHLCRAEATASARTPDIVVLRTLGAGGMGVVELALQPALGREVAIKRIRNPEKPQAAVDALVREASITGSLEHPNVVPIHLVGLIENDEPVVVMKRIQGKVWSELLVEDPAVGDDAALERHLEVLLQLCNALAFAHSRGIIHRDVKPDNVMLGAFGEVYLLDWGAAYDTNRDEPRAMVGTPVYMAPEQIDPSLGAVGPHTDVYLLGATLHELLTGEVRHQADSLMAVLQQALASPPFDYSESVAPELAELCNQACAREPPQRLADVKSFREALRTYRERRHARLLCSTAETRFQKLVDELADSTPAEAKLQGLFAEARFGFEQALHLSPGLARAQQGKQRCIEAIISFELGRRNLAAAESLAAQLDTLSEALSERMVALRDDVDVARARLEALEREQDRVVGRRERGWLALIIGLLFGFSIVVTWIRGWQGVSAPPSFALFRIGAITWLAVFAAAFFWRRKLWSSAPNRQVVASVLGCSTAVLLNRLFGWLHESMVAQVLVVDMLIFGLGLLLLTPFLRSGLWSGMGCWLLVGVSITWPATIMYAFSLALVLIAITVLAGLRGLRAKPIAGLTL